MIGAAYDCLARAPSYGAIYRRLCFPGLTNWLRPRRGMLLLAVRPYTMLSRRRLSRLYTLAGHCVVEGAFVECGTWRGGSAALLASQGRDRQTWAFDSFLGCPPPSDEDVSSQGRHGEAGEACAEMQSLLDIAHRLGVSDRLRIVPGWFAKSVPHWAGKIGQIALLHLDADWYESTKICLENLYPHVAAGGHVVVDDYGYWQGCRKAVDEYLSGIGHVPSLHWNDHTGVDWRKAH